MPKPQVVLSLDPQRRVVKGSTRQLNRLIARGADLRISTGFLHNEHIELGSPDNQLIAETSTFAETVLIDGKWSAGFMTLRQPVSLLPGFIDVNGLSLFLYNQDGLQNVARLVMDGSKDATLQKATEQGGFPKMRTLKVDDAGTGGVSKSFIYDFEFYDYIATDCYQELYAHTAQGRRRTGSIDALGKAYRQGRAIKIAIKGLSSVLWGDTGHTDEIFIHCGSSYYYTESKLMFTNTHPFVSVPADIPLTYKPKRYRYCWVIARTDGQVSVRTYNVFKNAWETQVVRLPLRWFAQT